MKQVKVLIYPEKTKTVELNCEKAVKISDKMKGLMYREKLDKDKGMLFEFLFPWHRFFWMKNVKIPLDLIFINSKKRVIKIYEAPIEPGPFYKMYWSHGFCKYVVETNIGFCKKNNIKKNTKIKKED